MNLKDKLAKVGFADAVAKSAKADDDEDAKRAAAKAAEDDDDKKASDDEDEDDDKKAKKAKAAKAKSKAKAEDDDDDDDDDKKHDDDDDDDDEKSKSKSKARGRAVSHRSIQLAERARIADIFDAADAAGQSMDVAGELAFGTDLDAKSAIKLLTKLSTSASYTLKEDKNPLSQAMSHIPNHMIPSSKIDTSKAVTPSTKDLVSLIMSQSSTPGKYNW